MRLPSLNALRAFEAAARHGGYIAAAEELNVTRGAVSRQVKSLEDHLGMPLFRRHTRGVELNEAGRALLPVLTKAFGDISEGVERLGDRRAALRVICPPALSIRWLLPRLPEFKLAHPDIRLRITTDFFGDRGFDGDEFDIGFSCQTPPGKRSSDMIAEPLIPYILCPACAPGLLRDKGPLDGPSDLVRLGLICERHTDDDWVDWLRHFGVEGVDVADADHFPNFDLAVKAAVMGAGVIMADLFLCHEELAKGSLVLPFPEMTCPSPWGWFSLLYASTIRDEPDVTAFRTWIVDAAATDRRATFGDKTWA